MCHRFSPLCWILYKKMVRSIYDDCIFDDWCCRNFDLTLRSSTKWLSHQLPKLRFIYFCVTDNVHLYGALLFLFTSFWFVCLFLSLHIQWTIRYFRIYIYISASDHWSLLCLRFLPGELRLFGRLEQNCNWRHSYCIVPYFFLFFFFACFSIV